MKNEKSAGGLVIRYDRGETQILLIKDKSGKWSFPKGLVKKGEDEGEGAKREIKEETGIKKLKFLYKLKPIEYKYKWEDKLIQKSVVYFLYQNTGNEILRPQTEEGIMAVQWFDIEKARKIIGYPKSNLSLLDEAVKVLN